MSADAVELLGKLDPKRLDAKVTGALKDSVKGVMSKLSRERGKLRQALVRYVSPDKTERLLQADIDRRAKSSVARKQLSSRSGSSSQATSTCVSSVKISLLAAQLQSTSERNCHCRRPRRLHRPRSRPRPPAPASSRRWLTRRSKLLSTPPFRELVWRWACFRILLPSARTSIGKGRLARTACASRYL